MTMVVATMCLAGAARLYAAARFLRTEPVTGQPVVTDAKVGLMWQGCAAGQSGTACATGTADTSYPWQAALAYCEGLTWGGFSDWRLPNLTELISIVAMQQASPAIDPVAFPATPAVPSGCYWTSSPFGSGRNWCIDFQHGTTETIGDSGGPVGPAALYVRCVRLGS